MRKSRMEDILIILTLNNFLRISKFCIFTRIFREKGARNIFIRFRYHAIIPMLPYYSYCEPFFLFQEVPILTFQLAMITTLIFLNTGPTISVYSISSK